MPIGDGHLLNGNLAFLTLRTSSRCIRNAAPNYRATIDSESWHIILEISTKRLSESLSEGARTRRFRWLRILDFFLALKRSLGLSNRPDWLVHYHSNKKIKLHFKELHLVSLFYYFRKGPHIERVTDRLPVH